MPFRLYLVPVIGSGSREDNRRPKYVAALSVTDWWAMDYGFEPLMLLGADLRADADAYLCAQPDVWAFPSDMTPRLTDAQVATVQAELEARALPGQWVTAAATWQDVVRTLRGILSFMQRFGGVYATQTGQIPAVFRGGVTLETPFGRLRHTVRAALLRTAASFGRSPAGLTTGTPLRTILTTMAEACVPQPAVASGVEPLAQLATDTFTRADNTTLGANWTAMSISEGFLNFRITSNACKCPSVNANCASAYTGLGPIAVNMYAQCIYNITQEGGPCVRMDLANTIGYMLNLRDAANDVVLRKIIAGVWTALGNAVFPSQTASDVMYLEAQGTTLVSKQNGTVRHNLTDSGVDGVTVGGPYAGLYGFNTNMTLDNFSMGDFGPATVVPARPTVRLQGVASGTL